MEHVCYTLTVSRKKSKMVFFTCSQVKNTYDKLASS